MNSTEAGGSPAAGGSLFSESEPESIAYSSVSRLAVAGVAIGLVASWTALINPWLCIVPVLGAILSGLAIWTIRRSDGALVGESLALAGLALSLAIGSAAVSAHLTQTWYLRREARTVAERWFEFLRHGEPHKAHQLCQPERNRQPLDSTLWRFYRDSPTDRGQLKEFVDNATVHALLALGMKAQVRYWGTEEIVPGTSKHLIGQLYTVTFDGPERRQTFFVRISMERLAPPDSAVQWRIDNYEGGVRPYERSPSP